MKRRHSTATAFTLVELLVVVAVVALLAAFLAVRISAARERARRHACVGNLRQLGLGIMMYASDHAGRFPNGASGMARYVANEGKLFCCSSDPHRTPTARVTGLTAAHNSYLYRRHRFDATGACLSDSNSPNTLLMCDKNGLGPAPTTNVEAEGAWGGNHRGEGGNILFIDGHVEWFNVHHRGDSTSLNNDLWHTMTTSNGLHASAWEGDDGW